MGIHGGQPIRKRITPRSGDQGIYKVGALSYGGMMSEAPKKIWVSDMGGWFEQEGCGFDIPYIRADLVDELVEALKRLLPLAEDSTTHPELNLDILDARAALAKLEESHE